MLEKATYLKGLINGLDLDESKKETKIILEMTKIIEEMAEKIDSLEALCNEAHTKIDIIDDDLAFLEEDFYDKCGSCNCEDCNCDSCDCGCGDDLDDLDDEDLPNIECPSCGKEIEVTVGDLKKGHIICPECDTILELELEKEIDDSEE